MGKKDGGSGRDNVRVSVFFPALWRVCDAESDLARQIENHSSSDRLAVPPNAFKDLPSDLTDLTEFQETSPQMFVMWMSLERKLDYITRQLNPKLFDDKSMKQCHCMDLSAGGASLRMGEKPSVGRYILVRLAPPTFPQFVVEAIGVIKSVEPDGKENAMSVARVEFTSINQNDREDLILYVFKRQREILRMKSG